MSEITESLHARVYETRWHVVAQRLHVGSSFRTNLMYGMNQHPDFPLVNGEDLRVYERPRVPIDKFQLIGYTGIRGRMLPEGSSWRGDPVYAYTEFCVYPPAGSPHWAGWEQRHHRDDLWPKRFHDYGEAIAFAQVEAFRESLKAQLVSACDDGQFFDHMKAIQKNFRGVRMWF